MTSIESIEQPRNGFLYPFADPSLFSQDIGAKAAKLAEMFGAGLPVPPGYVITSDVHRHYLDTGQIPEEVVAEIKTVKQELGGEIIIRSSANCEDGNTLSMAGVFTSEHVSHDDEIEPTLKMIFDDCRSETVAEAVAIHGLETADIYMNLVVQKLVQADVSGVMYTLPFRQSLVQYVDGFGGALVDGTTTGSSLLLNSSGVITSSAGFDISPLSPHSVEQLATYSEKICGLYPDAPQDIEFAIQDDFVHIVQTRPLTADLSGISGVEQSPLDCLRGVAKQVGQLVLQEQIDFGIDNTLFCDANYSEILPRPAPMDIGLYQYVWGGSDNIPGAKQLGHTQMGYKVPPEATGMISYIGGRTYFSMARNAALYHAGFPEKTDEYFSTLLKEYMDTANEHPERAGYPQMGLFLQDPTLQDLQSRFGDKANKYFETYLAFSEALSLQAEGFDDQFRTELLPKMTLFFGAMSEFDFASADTTQILEYVQNILEHIRTRSYVNFVLGARLGFYFSQKLQNMLNDQMAHDSQSASEIFSTLTSGLDGSIITDSNIAIAEADSDEAALDMARASLGHISIGEMLEIRHPMFADRPAMLAQYVSGIRSAGSYKQAFHKQKAARIKCQNDILAQVDALQRPGFERTIHYAQKYMALRETTKYWFTKEYQLLRNALENLSSKIGLQGDDIYFVYPRELPQLAENTEAFVHLIKARRHDFEKNYPKLNMPSVLRISDIPELTLKHELADDFDELQGAFLAAGERFRGVTINVNDFDTNHPRAILEAIAQYRAQGTSVILVATQLNLSHDPLIAQADGLIIENAGLVAHGAQRARELGKGAIGSVPTALLKTGTYIIFDPSRSRVTKSSAERDL